MKAEVYICDICSVRKEESNHWLLATIIELAGISFDIWNHASYNDQVKHLCGIGCANKLLSQTVESWSKPVEEK